MNRNSLKDRIQFKIGEIIFFILPVKFLKIYVYLATIMLLNKARYATIDIDMIDLVKFQQLLHVSLNKEVLLLPQATLGFLWDDDIYNCTILCNNVPYKLSDLIKNDELFHENIVSVVKQIYSLLPEPIKFKLTRFNKSSEYQVIYEMSEAVA